MAKEKESAKANSICKECGHARPARYKQFQFFWMQHTDLELGDLPEGAILEIHPSHILVDAGDDWRVLIPMDRIRFINVKEPV